MIISAGRSAVETESKSINAMLLSVWNELQAELVGLSTKSERIIAKDSDHRIYDHQPALIISAVRTLIERTKQ